jgi:predicted nucleotidyltransferase
MSPKIYSVDEIKKRFEKVAKKYEIEEAYLFGSYARGDATKKSDIDFYVKADNIRSLFVLGGFYADTKDAMKKNIDLITTDAILEKGFEEQINADQNQNNGPGERRSVLIKGVQSSKDFGEEKYTPYGN